MRIHTSLFASDLQAALIDAGIKGVYVDVRETFNSRKAANGYDVTLYAEPGEDKNGKKRRHKNSGNYGADRSYAATYDEHGWWMARLFAADEDMILDNYKGADSFHAQTRYQYA